MSENTLTLKYAVFRYVADNTCKNVCAYVYQATLDQFKLVPI